MQKRMAMVALKAIALPCGQRLHHAHHTWAHSMHSRLPRKRDNAFKSLSFSNIIREELSGTCMQSLSLLPCARKRQGAVHTVPLVPNRSTWGTTASEILSREPICNTSNIEVLRHWTAATKHTTAHGPEYGIHCVTLAFRHAPVRHSCT